MNSSVLSCRPGRPHRGDHSAFPWEYRFWLRVRHAHHVAASRCRSRCPRDAAPGTNPWRRPVQLARSRGTRIQDEASIRCSILGRGLRVAHRDRVAGGDSPCSFGCPWRRRCRRNVRYARQVQNAPGPREVEPGPKDRALFNIPFSDAWQCLQRQIWSIVGVLRRDTLPRSTIWHHEIFKDWHFCEPW